MSEAGAGGRAVDSLAVNPAIESLFATRTAATEAAFFLLYLRPGMRPLDCGPGPGSIICDLATVVAPGEVVGIDIQQAQIEGARASTYARGLSNARFECGDVTAIPFADASFDAAFAHMVLMWMPNPLAALREMRRVLKPGGPIGIADTDASIWRFAPSTPLLEAWQRLNMRVREHNGASPFYAGRQRTLLLEAASCAARRAPRLSRTAPGRWPRRASTPRSTSQSSAAPPSERRYSGKAGQARTISR